MTMQFFDYYTPCWLNFWFWGHSEYHRHSNNVLLYKNLTSGFHKLLNEHDQYAVKLIEIKTSKK